MLLLIQPLSGAIANLLENKNGKNINDNINNIKNNNNDYEYFFN